MREYVNFTKHAIINTFTISEPMYYVYWVDTYDYYHIMKKNSHLSDRVSTPYRTKSGWIKFAPTEFKILNVQNGSIVKTNMNTIEVNDVSFINVAIDTLIKSEKRSAIITPFVQNYLSGKKLMKILRSIPNFNFKLT